MGKGGAAYIAYYSHHFMRSCVGRANCKCYEVSTFPETFVVLVCGRPDSLLSAQSILP